MKKRLFSVLLCLCVIQTIQAQLTIDGRHVCLDTITNTMLATLPETCFGQSLTLDVSLESGWNTGMIDDSPIDGNYTFENINATQTYHLQLYHSDGDSIDTKLQFTFLPIIQLKGDFGYDYQSGTILFSDPSTHYTDTLSATIKWRGGSTNIEGKNKRNYKLKLDADTTLLGMRNDNNWILDAGQPDVFRMRNRIAMDIWNDMAHQPYYADLEPKARNGVSGHMVELFLNDEYRGIYNLSENIDRKQMKIKKIDKETGAIRGCLYKGISWQNTNMFSILTDYDNHQESFYGYEVKYPDLNDSDTTDWLPLVSVSNIVRDMTKEQFIEEVDQYFDLPVLADYSIFLTVVNALDNSGKNMFWAVYDKNITQRLTLAPWDLDCTFGQRWGGTLVGQDDDMTSPDYLTDVDIYVFYQLYHYNAFQFNDQMNQRYRELRETGNVLSTDSLINRVTHYYNLITNSGAAQRETNKWSGDTDIWGEAIDFQQEYDYICQWIKQHMEAIDSIGFPVFYNDSFFAPDYISPAIVFDGSDFRDIYYDLQGRKVDRPTKPGIYIRNGKKIIVSGQ